MKRNYATEEPRTVTLAELCEALADGTLPSQQHEGYYVVNRRELNRFAQPFDLVSLIMERATVRELVAVS
ncbi:MAG TPA: hypothetical protein VEW94_05800 [Chloroflexia bacterium]|nr:hypothetical protein [Chloroflexia bacterium]